VLGRTGKVSAVNATSRTRTALALAAVCVIGTLGSVSSATAAAAQPVRSSIPALPLGSADLPQSSTTRHLEPGVTLTEITRGAFDPATGWVVELSIPGGASSPDPDAPARSVQDLESADELVTRLASAGFGAAAEAVRQPKMADVDASVIGYRVRLTEQFPTDTAAKSAATALKAAGFTGRDWYTGWDGGGDVAGQWNVKVLTIDPRAFRGQRGATYGPDVENRETTTVLGESVGATAAINAGFFVLDPKAGAPGDPAGVGVYNGVLESETTAGRPALLLTSNARHTAVIRPSWQGTVFGGKRGLTLDGINRVPGLIRNCGGVGDQPTDLPQHDVTCTDPDELIVFTTAFGAMTPAGPGAEVVLDRQSRVVTVNAERGVALQPGQRSVQATGADVADLSGLRPGQLLQIDTRITDGRANLARPGVSVINGGPQLVQNGQVHITQQTDGMVHADDPSFAYGWVLQRNPRTFAGVDAWGRTVLVTVDGRQPGDLGLSIPETAAVAKALGMTEAINLDGGGSTAMAVDGQLISHPSDAAGERPVGDAIYIG
jgi:hypothetical protein